MAARSGEITMLLQQYASGNKQALDALTPLVYPELRRLAASFMHNERKDSTLQPTALIHEAYLQLVREDSLDFVSRSHFFGIAAHVMRQILVSSARRHRALKRGGDFHRIDFEDDLSLHEVQFEELLAVDQALDRLASQDERKAKVMELKYFGGLSREEIAAALGLTLATVKRDTSMGEAWLRRALFSEASGG